MKKHLIFFILSLLPIIASADAIKINGIYYVLNEELKCASVSNKPGYWGSYSGHIVIPERIVYAGIEYVVNAIGNSAFKMCEEMTSCEIPNTIKSIGNESFNCCKKMESIIIPESVEIIGNNAFAECVNLSNIVLSTNISTIGYYAFYKTAWYNELYNKSDDGVIYINRVAYTVKGENLVKIIIKEGTLGIASNAFIGCSDLYSVTIPNGVTNIGDKAFQYCSSLTSITIPNSVMSIGESTFEGCSSLTSVTIPIGVTTIGISAFNGCSSLSSITIPSSVKTIHTMAFYKCNKLTAVHISNLEAWCDIYFEEPWTNPLFYAHHLFLNGQELTSLNVTNGVTNIRNYAFYNCSGLTSVYIPNSVTGIGDYAFYNCSGLTSITIPNSVTSIGEYAFCGCSKAISLKLPNNLSIIKKSSFSGCSKLKSVVIPSTVEFIYQGAFANCTSLESVKVLAEIPPFLYDNSFSKYNIPLYVPESAIEAYQTTSPWSKFSQFKTLDGTEVEIKKCAKPTIAYKDGKVTFNSDTEDVQYVYTITDADVRQGNGSGVDLAATYNISVRATRAGYEDSETATATYSWKGITPMMNGEIAKYRLSFIVDNKELSAQNVEVGANITVPTTKDNDGNTITWYTYPSTMPAHDLVVYGMVVKPEPEPAPTKYTLSYILDGRHYKQDSIDEGATVAKETEPTKEGYTFSGWQNEPTTMPGRNVTVTGSFTINSYRLSFIAENKELSAKNQQYGTAINAPTKDSEGNTITWYTYPSTMPAHDLVVYGMAVKQPEVFVWLTVKDGQGTTKMRVKQGTEQKLTITPEEGWKLLTVTMDGQEVTTQVKDGGTLTTPAIMQDATITVVYEQNVPSEVSAARLSQATIKVVDDGVIINNAEPNTRCAVYRADGKQVVSTVINDASRKITLTKGQAYILTLGIRTLKFSL